MHSTACQSHRQCQEMPVFPHPQHSAKSNFVLPAWWKVRLHYSMKHNEYIQNDTVIFLGNLKRLLKLFGIHLRPER